MWYRALADLLVVLHLAFAGFVALGGLLVLRRPRLARVHVPAVLWGVLIEFTGWTCPLTPWEQSLRQLGGEAGYTGGFVEHYLVPALYPADLTRSVQIILGGLVLVVNLAVYGRVLRSRSRR